MLEARGLHAVTFSGHMDLSREENLDLYFKKMAFASALGVRVIGAFGGPVDRKSALLRNLERVQRRAEELDLIVGLETESPEDLVATGRRGAELVREFNSPRVRLCYDTGNVYYANQGRIDLEKDLEACRDLLSNLHLKDAYWEGSWYRYGAVGQGLFGYASLGRVLRGRGEEVPLTIEIPYYLKSREWKPFTVESETRALGKLEQMVCGSVAAVRRLLPVEGAAEATE
jgi:sugar phosphate isomerase/epimerase